MADKIRKYTKEQFYESKRYFNQKDVLMATLEDGKEYTVEEVEQAIENFMNRKVVK